MSLITILTPTYNRAHTLPLLYDSLKKQECKDFIWMVVDDGSSDNTKQVVESFQNDEKSYDIQYIQKKNGGKHTALNVGIKKINTPLVFIVDSDDQLLSNAIKDVVSIYNKYKDIKEIRSYTFLRCYSNQKPIVPMERDEFVEYYIDYRIRQDRPGDMAEVYYTDVLREFPFPEFEGERFLSEDVVWIEIGKKYKSVYINKSIYQCEYLEGGLTLTDKLMKFASPKGSMLRGKRLMSKECGIKANIKGAIIYNCYKSEVSDVLPEILKPSFREKCLLRLTKPLGKVFYKKWKA